MKCSSALHCTIMVMPLFLNSNEESTMWLSERKHRLSGKIEKHSTLDYYSFVVYI